MYVFFITKSKFSFMQITTKKYVLKKNYIFDWSHQLDKNMAIGSPASSVGRARDS